MVLAKKRVVMWAALVAVGACSIDGIATARGDNDGDFSKKIAKVMPSGWTVTFVRPDGERLGCIQIRTNKIETRDTNYADDIDEVRTETIDIDVEVHPRYSPAKIEEMEGHNKAIYETLRANKVGLKRAATSPELIRVPQFHDNNYSYFVRHHRRRPSRIEDRQKLKEVIKAVSAEWKSYGPGNPDVVQAIGNILNR